MGMQITTGWEWYLPSFRRRCIREGKDAHRTSQYLRASPRPHLPHPCWHEPSAMLPKVHPSDRPCHTARETCASCFPWPGMSLARSPTGTFIDALLRTDSPYAGIQLRGGLAPPATGLSPARRCVPRGTQNGKKPIGGIGLYIGYRSCFVIYSCASTRFVSASNCSCMIFMRTFCFSACRARSSIWLFSSSSIRS